MFRQQPSRRRRDQKSRSSRCALLGGERFGCDQLERRIVLDGLPVLGGDVLTIGPEINPTGTAQLGDLTYEVVGGQVTITNCSKTAVSVVIPAEIDGLPVTSIGDNAFYANRSLTSVTIPDSVTSIKSRAFSGCNSLTNITIPDGVTSIGSSAFNGCMSLTNITIPDSVTSVGNWAFQWCKGLTSITIGDGTIGDGVTSIGDSAFQECTSLTSITILGRVTSIRDSTFRRCTSLTSVTIPDSVTSIEYGAFYECTSLTSVTIGDGVTSIGAKAFMACRSLTSVTIPVTVTVLEPEAFLICTSLTSVTIGDGVTSIGPGAFSGCISLTSITIGDGVTSIGGAAFSNCISLTSITIGDGVTSIGDSAFRGCTSLTSLTFKGSPPEIGLDTFGNTTATVYYYPNQPGWGSSFGGRPAVAIQTGLPDQVVDVPSGETAMIGSQEKDGRLVKRGPGTLVLDVASTRTGGLLVEGGTLILRSSQALGTGGISVAAGARVVFETGNTAVELAALEVDTTAQIDVGTSRITVAAGGFTEADIRQRLLSGYNFGLWDGTGISSSAAPYGSNRAVGYRIADGILELAWAAFGDTNLDGVLNSFDLVGTLSGGKFNTQTPASWQDGDFNYDGRFNIVDLVAMNGTGLFGQGSYLPQEPSPAAAQSLDPMWVFAALATEGDDE